MNNMELIKHFHNLPFVRKLDINRYEKELISQIFMRERKILQRIRLEIA